MVVPQFLGQVAYEPTVQAMREFTQSRQAHAPDQLWLCEHPPVFTLGVAGLADHVLSAGEIGLVRSDRGGQVTYHGPGQVVAYPLIDLRPLKIYVKEYVYRLEQALLKTLEIFGVTGHRVVGAPGIYVQLQDPFGHHALPTGSVPFAGLAKIAAIGIKVTRHCAYHGVALNVAMDLAPFERINPCGYIGLQTVDLARIGVVVDPSDVAHCLAQKLALYLTP